LSREELTALDEWCDEWLGADVINHSLTDDPAALPPGFNLHRHLWANLHRCRTDQGQTGQCVAAARTWNSLPTEVTLSNSLQTFKTKQKSHLFLASFS